MVSRARSNLITVDAYLGTLELDEVGEARAEIARTLAGKLDKLASSTTATDAMAIAGVAKGLREVLDEIAQVTEDTGGFVNDLFATVGDSADS